MEKIQIDIVTYGWLMNGNKKYFINVYSIIFVSLFIFQDQFICIAMYVIYAFINKFCVSIIYTYRLIYINIHRYI